MFSWLYYTYSKTLLFLFNYIKTGKPTIKQFPIAQELEVWELKASISLTIHRIIPAPI